MKKKQLLLERRKFLGLIGSISTSIFLPNTLNAKIKNEELSELLGHSYNSVPENVLKYLDNRDIFVSKEEKQLAEVMLNKKFNVVKYSKSGKEKRLFMYNIHTGEFLNEVFWADGYYITENFDKINYFMRDFRENKVKKIDRHVIEGVYKVSLNTKKNRPLILNSAYRTPKTNKKIGGAKHSQHKLGKALDFSLDKYDHTSLASLHRFLLKHHTGGVGYYPKQNFIHIDAGNKRHWYG